MDALSELVDVWDIATKVGVRTKVEFPDDVDMTLSEDHKDKVHKAAIRAFVAILEEEGLELVKVPPKSTSRELA